MSNNRNKSNYGNYCPTVSYLKDAPLANVQFTKCDNKEELVKSVDAFRRKKYHEAVLLVEEWALQIFKPDVPHILSKAIEDDNETKEQYNEVSKVDRNRFKFNNQNLATKDNNKTQQKYNEFVTDSKQNQSKQKPELVQIINTEIVDILSKAEIIKLQVKKCAKILLLI